METAIPGQPPATADASTEPVRRSVRPALLLFILSPLIAEYLLGNVSISALGYLVIFAPLYGASPSPWSKRWPYGAAPRRGWAGPV